MVELAPFYILVLRGPTLIVEAYNPRHARYLDGRAVQGRPLDEVIDLFWEAGVEIVHLARDAYRTDTIFTTHRMLTHLPSTKDAHNSNALEAYFEYTIVPSHDTQGKVDGLIIYATDETEKRQREAAEEHERLQMIFDHFSLAALALYDAETSELLIGSFRYLEAVARLLKLPLESIKGRKFQELAMASSEQQAMQLWGNVLETHETLRIPELPYKASSNDTEIIWDYSLTPIMDVEQPERVRYILVSAIEITEQVQARKELEQLDSLKDDFLELVTHELRSPLTIIQGNVQLLQRNLQRLQTSQQHGDGQEQSSENETAMLTRISQQIRRMNELIEEMMDVTRIREKVLTLHNPQTIDLAELARRVVQQFTSLDHEIVLHTDGDSIRTTVDVSRTEQALNNLISNAIKYSPPDKPITVSVTRSNDHVNEAVVAVSDKGQGISKDEQEHIFERFYRATATDEQADGLGLGLYIVREIIAQQRGRVWIESEPGQGSTFFFSLPLHTS
jgi:signal transduction histidine kinase